MLHNMSAIIVQSNAFGLIMSKIKGHVEPVHDLRATILHQLICRNLQHVLSSFIFERLGCPVFLVSSQSDGSPYQ